MLGLTCVIAVEVPIYSEQPNIRLASETQSCNDHELSMSLRMLTASKLAILKPEPKLLSRKMNVGWWKDSEIHDQAFKDSPCSYDLH